MRSFIKSETAFVIEELNASTPAVQIMLHAHAPADIREPLVTKALVIPTRVTTEGNAKNSMEIISANAKRNFPGVIAPKNVLLRIKMDSPKN